MSKKKKTITRVVCTILLSIAVIGSAISSLGGSFNIGTWVMFRIWELVDPPIIYELTEDEKKWLTAKFGDEERIEEGKLYPSEEKQLMRARAGMAMLEEKYPGYQFCITWLDRYDTWTGFTVYEKSTEEEVVMNVEGDEESGYKVTDNFYEYFFAEKYAAYIQRVFEKKGIDEVTVRTGLYSVRGREYDINMSVEDVISGRLEVEPSITLKVYIGDVTEDECAERACELQEIIEETDIFGAYNLYFKNISKDEMLISGESGEIIYDYYFQFFDRKGKE